MSIKTAADILRLYSCFPVEVRDYETEYVISVEDAAEAMKAYAEQFIELAANTAEAYIGIGCDGEDTPIVSEGSILRIKEQIK